MIILEITQTVFMPLRRHSGLAQRNLYKLSLAFEMCTLAEPHLEAFNFAMNDKEKLIIHKTQRRQLCSQKQCSGAGKALLLASNLSLL